MEEDEFKDFTSNSWIKDLLFLDTMLTPKIMTFVYWIMLLVVVFGGLARIFILKGSLWGIFGILLGAVFVRIWCEIFVIFFRMNEALQEMRKK